MEKQLNYEAVESQIKFLQGKVLTVIEASVSNDKQLKAVKDLINQQFREQLDWVHSLCFGHVGRGNSEVNEVN